MALFDTEFIEEKAAHFDDPSQDGLVELLMAGLADLPAGTQLAAEATEHGFKVWNPANKENG